MIAAVLANFFSKPPKGAPLPAILLHCLGMAHATRAHARRRETRARVGALTSILPYLGIVALTLCPAGRAPAQPPVEIYINNDDGPPHYIESGDWSTSASTGYNGGTYRHTSTTRDPSYCIWSAQIPVTDTYQVYAIFLRSNNRTPSAPYTITHANGTTVVNVSQLGTGFEPAYLGSYEFQAGSHASIRLDNSGAPGAYIADTIYIRTAVDEPPVITGVHHLPGYPQEGDTVTVRATVTDDYGLDHVAYEYVVNGSVFHVYPAVEAGGLWTGTIPSYPEGTHIAYRFQATDTADQQTGSDQFEYIVGEKPPPEYRSIWADTWGRSILNQEQVDELIDTARANNINTVMIEIRKVGDAYYDSALEPRATNISGGPNFDPLQATIDRAHEDPKRRVEVHGWFVMQRIWRTSLGPVPPGHVVYEHPEYVMLDYEGNSTGGGNIYLDPGHPGAVDFNIAVILDCMEKYDLDGVNLDYIRYPEASGHWGYNPTSVERFNRIYGKEGLPHPADPDWADWRRQVLTLAVKKLYVKMWKLKPEVVLTADTVNWGFAWNNWENSSPYNGVYQDWVGWLQEGIIDYNALMSYSRTTDRHQGWTLLSLANDDIRGSIIGIGAYLQTSVQDSMDQLLWAREQGPAGLNIYDWYSEANGTSETRTDFYRELRNQVFTEWTDPPKMTWKLEPTKGIFEGTVTAHGVPVDHADIFIDDVPGRDTISDGSGWYGILEVPPGRYTLRFFEEGYPERHVTALIGAGDIITIDVDLAVDPPTPTGWIVE